MVLKTMKVACAGAAVAALAQVGALHAQEETHRMNIQTAVPTSSLYFGLVEDFAEKVETMSGGRIEVEVLPDGAEVAAFEILDAVSNCVVEAGYAWPHYWSGKHPAYVLFSNVPASTGMDQQSLMSWYYSGEGRALYTELTQDIMGMNVVPFLMQPMGPDPLGWFSKPFENMDEFRSIKYRSPPGIAGQTYNAMGVPAVAMPGGDIVPSAQRGTIDAAEWIGPADDRNLGLDSIWNYYYLQGLHQQTDVGELVVCRDFWDDLPEDLRAIVETAVMANVAMTQAVNLHENAKAVREYEEEGIQLLDTPDEYYELFIEAQNEVVQDYLADDPFFARVYKSQADFAELVYPYYARVRKLHSEVVTGAERVRRPAE
ncbi:TRAP transporter substrate-binding protein [Aquibium sp. A9E412]|uniref:TRAP transporter substrate-binding protein n=1 Tax=Aquibium sp. A9E412 TaxID=2976767 RepID=UPI0025B11DE1|nr:TRAP transporter substrate-binding protein [Aquibium sp. A9E412]MDN2567082.1 TRAP transporter substrate-binding protein [Aquibium sp. A9E412]